MKKIVILGCENSHAHGFLELITTKKEFSDISVIGVYSEEKEAAEKLRDTFGVPVMQNFTDAAGQVDGAMITARHGNNHLPYAEPYIPYGIPLFIDKPVTILESDAVTMMKKMRENGVRVSGGSSLQYDLYVRNLKEERENKTGGKTLGGYVRAPFQAENKYGGFFFYAPHLVEMVLTIFGRYPKSVRAARNGGQVHVLFRYDDYDCAGLLCDGNYLYYASRMAEKSATSFLIPSSDNWIYGEMKTYHSLLSGGEMPVSYKDFISSVFVLNAVEKALREGKEIPVDPVEL